MKIKKIVHLGDVHFFIGKKFKEHEYVCKEFYKELETENPDICVITGDLIDSKSKLGSEQIDLCRRFLKNITNVCPLIIILGNHDLNLNNENKIDSISPILYSLYNETINPIHFFKHSGVYNLYGINWAVWSCLDEENPFPKNYIKNCEGYTIGLYHGPVKGCISDTGFIMSSGLDIEEFNLCDEVMMSDIHLVQGFRPEETIIEIEDEDLQNYLDDDWEVVE